MPVPSQKPQFVFESSQPSATPARAPQYMPTSKGYPEYHKELAMYLIPIVLVWVLVIIGVLALFVGTLNHHKKMLEYYAGPDIVDK